MALSASGAQMQAHGAPEASAQLSGVSEPQHHAPQPAASAAASQVLAQAEHSAGGSDPAAMPAMFWDTLPEGESQHPDKLAMDAMMEELTPAERAANLKVHSGLLPAFETMPLQQPLTLFSLLGGAQQMHSNGLCLACITPAATPYTRAHWFWSPSARRRPQVRGNDAFKRGVQLRKKFYLREAADLYTQGLAASGGDAVLEAVLYANRAEV